MSKHELESVELTNMCMIYDLVNDKVLVQRRNKNDWDGLSFPGGHVELGEGLIPAVIREVYEETGLIISNLKVCGFKDWYDFKTHKRYLVLLFKTQSYHGKLKKSSCEGENLWMRIEEVRKSITAEDFLEMLDIFLDDNKNEFFYEDNKSESEEKRWIKRFY